MAPQETGKQRASRIPLDYYKRPDRLSRWKLRLSVVALLAALGWCALGFLPGQQSQRVYSRGQVAAVHATWEDNCNACHEPFRPIGREKNWLTPVFAKAHGSASRCEICHAGPPHHASQKPEDTPTCGGCHRDHRGRDASLVRLADSDCTGCHQDLKNHMAGEPKFENKVTRFATDHPEFRTIGDPNKEPGKLRFSHARHMALGMKLPDGGPIYTVEKIRNPADQKRYSRGQPLSAPVQLQCADCHESQARTPSAEEQRDAHRPAPTSGAYMLPPTYDKHCQACHALTLWPNPEHDPKGKPLTVPHHLQPDALTKFLWGAYGERYLAEHPPAVPRPLPGQPPGETPQEKQAREEIGRNVNEADQFLRLVDVRQAEKLLFLGRTTCGECHHYETQEGRVAPRRIVPPEIPEVWFTHAKFDHAAHRALDCRQCHARAYDTTQRAEKSQLLPRKTDCLQCHGHPSQSVLGARSDCTECHRYHHGESPLQGLGETHGMDVQQFLSGGQPNR